MITLGLMTWEDMFSYGSNNSIDFNSFKLLQILGKNGHGKSSIGLILEEILYNKNAKGIKRGDIINRYSKSGKYKASLAFSKGNDQYFLEVSRGSTQTVKLTRNGVEISAHTPTGTYKLIESIIGIDHETFTQIVNESSAFSLKFLTATDTTRKKFLIDLFKLGRYTEISSKLKDAHDLVNAELKAVVSSITTLSRLLEKHKAMDLEPLTLVGVPETPHILEQELFAVTDELQNLDQRNQRIDRNNLLKDRLAKLNVEVQPYSAVEYAQFEQDLVQITNNQVLDTKEEKDLRAIINGSTNIVSVCKACNQPIDITHRLEHLERAKASLTTLLERKSIKDTEKARLTAILGIASKIEEEKLEFERLSSLIDKDLPSTKKNSAELIKQQTGLQSSISKIKQDIVNANAYNSKAYAHNASIEVAKKLIKDTKDELDAVSTRQVELGIQLSKLAILVKAFSPTGLVAYKLECLTKDLEESVNQYLTELSDGRFNLTFRIAESDKLNVIISDNGAEVDILALSSGERARVNICTLLALRKLMQTITSAKLNLLILDETIDHLDEEGKEKLIEVLSKEVGLNTMLISHGFSHPLLEKLTVVKKNKISRIEHG